VRGNYFDFINLCALRLALGYFEVDMNLRRFLFDNFGWDIYEWDPADIIF